MSWIRVSVRGISSCDPCGAGCVAPDSGRNAWHEVTVERPVVPSLIDTQSHRLVDPCVGEGSLRDQYDTCCTAPNPGGYAGRAVTVGRPILPSVIDIQSHRVVYSCFGGASSCGPYGTGSTGPDLTLAASTVK